MNTDFRVTNTVFQNTKIRRLMRHKSGVGVLNLFQLWAFTSAHRSKGVLYGLDEMDIMDASGSNDETLVEKFVELRLLDYCDGVYSVHDWEQWNPWAMGAEKRSEAARKAVQTRWSRDARAKNKKA